MTPKQSEVLNSYKNKVANTKFVINAETYGSVNTLQTKKKFYNRALEIFIESQFGKDIHFGNMTNNFEKVIDYLKLEETIGFKLKVPTVTIKSLNINSTISNGFNDFEANSVFEGTIFARENVDSETFLKAVETIDNDFIAKYNTLAKEEIKTTIRKENTIKKKEQKKEILTYGSIGLAIVSVVFLYLKFLK